MNRKKSLNKVNLLFFILMIAWIGCQSPLDPDSQIPAISAIYRQVKFLPQDYMHQPYCYEPEIDCDNEGWVTRMNFSLKDIAILPKEIGMLPRLKELYLTSNELASLPKEIGQLTQLHELALDGNRFTTLPKEIGQLTQLQILSLSQNRLTALPKEIGQLVQLKELNLSGNQLEGGIPKEFDQLTNLTRLIVSWNRFTDTTLPPALEARRKAGLLEYHADYQRP